MTKIIFSVTREDGVLYFECSGHSQYKNPETDNNDVCVAVSALCHMLVRYIAEKGYDPKICTDGHVKIEIKQSNMKINEVFRAVMLEFKGLMDCYPDQIKVY